MCVGFGEGLCVGVGALVGFGAEVGTDAVWVGGGVIAGTPLVTAGVEVTVGVVVRVGELCGLLVWLPQAARARKMTRPAAQVRGLLGPRVVTSRGIRIGAGYGAWWWVATRLAGGDPVG